MNLTTKIVGVTADYVFFCISDPTEDVFDVGKHPFAFAAQYISAKYLVSITLVMGRAASIEKTTK